MFGALIKAFWPPKCSKEQSIMKMLMEWTQNYVQMTLEKEIKKTLQQRCAPSKGRPRRSKSALTPYCRKSRSCLDCLKTFSRKTFRLRVLQKIVSVCHTMHNIHKHHATHIHSTRILSIRIDSIVSNTYPSNKYPFNMYPFSTYPFKRYASAGMAMYVNAKHILAQEWQ